MQEINTQHCSSTRVYVSFFRFQKQEERFELKSHEIKVSDPANELRDRGSRGIRSAGDFTSLWGSWPPASILGPTWCWWRSRWRGRSSLTDAPTVAPRRSDWGGCGDKTHTFTHTQKHTHTQTHINTQAQAKLIHSFRHMKSSWLVEPHGGKAAPLVGDDVAVLLGLGSWFVLPQVVLVRCCSRIFRDSFWVGGLDDGGWSLCGGHPIRHGTLCGLMDWY